MPLDWGDTARFYILCLKQFFGTSGWRGSERSITPRYVDGVADTPPQAHHRPDLPVQQQSTAGRLTGGPTGGSDDEQTYGFAPKGSPPRCGTLRFRRGPRDPS